MTSFVLLLEICLGKELGKFETVSVPDRVYNDRRYCMDSGKVREELGWCEQVPFRDGIQLTVSWFLDNVEWQKLDMKHV